ncbi:MAG: hypothetical protein HYX69_08150 [Planctomycetia bacterium]|nr:hypothetical protein [Planctomycetia bacterium]
MKMNRSSVAYEYRLVSNFDEVSKKLLSEELADRLDKPLAFWALPSDRSSPIALMGRTLRELLATPFEQIFATPGIGQKKIHSLIELLNRAAQPLPPGAIEDAANDDGETGAASVEIGSVDTSLVSEALWVQWQQTVRDHALGRETLGRFSPSLQNLPRVIWNTPLDAYTELTLQDIRSLKTHGEKRVKAVLEVFGGLHALLARVSPQSHLGVEVQPKFVLELERWVTGVLEQTVAVDAEAIRRSFVNPLMAQLYVDAGEHIARLAESRLRLDGSGATVRQVARRLGLTRARVYQLLNDVGAMMSVRWPQGQSLVNRLSEALHAQIKDTGQLELFDAVCELFFPGKRPSAAFSASEPLPAEYAQQAT